MDLWALEREQWNQGFDCLCGVDEAGAGPLAGPVYAAAVILPRELEIPGLNDSKKLTEKKREALYEQITAQAEAWSVAFATAEEIDEIDILNARMLAMQRAIDGLDPAADFHPDAPRHPDRRRREKRLHRRRLHSGEGQPGPLCLPGTGRPVSAIRLCRTQGLRHKSPLRRPG